jgi:HTH DNA binding domain
MRRLVVELYGKELEKRIAQSSFHNIESMDMVHLLRFDQDENVAIWRMRLKDPSLSVEDCFKDDGVTNEVQVLERQDKQGEGPAFLVLLKRRARPGFLLGSGSGASGGYLSGPMGFKDGRIKFTFVGTQKDVKEILGRAEKRGLRYRVLLLTDAQFAPDSLLNRLTDKQRRILVLAYKLGYFDVPKKINSDELAARLHLTGSTVVEHLGKAEHRLLMGIINYA